ncbi:hypothetical protein ACA910_019185 [Epithemia clementina (nom. ined.)]
MAILAAPKTKKKGTIVVAGETNRPCVLAAAANRWLQQHTSTALFFTNRPQIDKDDVSQDQSRSKVQNAWRLSLTSSSSSPTDKKNNNYNRGRPWRVLLFGTVSFLYWYWMVLGSWAASQGLPGIPDWLPMHPGWPPSEADLQPVLDDAPHFFYLSELLGKAAEAAPPVQPVRLAAFNIPEAWVFAFLPLLWTDAQKWQRPAWLLPLLWATLGINLTNAFLAPYLFSTEVVSSNPQQEEETTTTTTRRSANPSRKNWFLAVPFGIIASAVVGNALLQLTTVATSADWQEFVSLAQTDRTYLAFCLDMILFSIFQPLVLDRVRSQCRNDSNSNSIIGNTSSLDAIPLVGLIAWLLLDNTSHGENLPQQE